MRRGAPSRRGRPEMICEPRQVCGGLGGAAGTHLIEELAEYHGS
jgi:hypothetical protein